MIKQEYRESEQRFEKTYGKSILSHDDDRTDSMKDYEFSISHHRDYDDDEDNNHSQSMDDYEWHIGHFEY